MHRDHAACRFRHRAGSWKPPTRDYSAAMLRNSLSFWHSLAWPGLSMAQPRSGIDLSSIDPAVPPQQDSGNSPTANGSRRRRFRPTARAGTLSPRYAEATQQQLRDVIEGIDRAAPTAASAQARRSLCRVHGRGGRGGQGFDGLREDLRRIHGLGERRLCRRCSSSVAASGTHPWNWSRTG